MKIWTEPKVTHIATTYPDLHGEIPYGFEFDYEDSGESVVEFAGRLCYLSFGEGVTADGHKTIQGRTNRQEYIDNILSVKHGSVIEHANYTFLLEGVSRSLTHELVRHRHFSYSQLSQRYVDESNVGFVLPPEILPIPDSKLYGAWVASCDSALSMYQTISNILKETVVDENKRDKIKRIRQTARSVLPNCTETKIVVTGNARAWRHFIMLRGNKHADTEIRRLTVVIAKHFHDSENLLFQDLLFANDCVTLEYGDV